MSFQPVIVGTGLVGWQFLKATRETQQPVFDQSPLLSRDTDYFLQRISGIDSAEQLVADRRLLRVALGAFGLQDDIDNRFFIRKILEEGTNDPDALANRLTDERYKALSRTFAFDGVFGPATKRAGFGEDIVARFRTQSFEIAVGEQDETLRLALNFERALPEMATASGDDTAWFRVMGTPPLRRVLETALALPGGFGTLDIDQQLEQFRESMQRRFGVTEIADIAKPEMTERVIQQFLLQTQVANLAQTGSTQIALSLLQAIPRRSLLS